VDTCGHIPEREVRVVLPDRIVRTRGIGMNGGGQRAPGSDAARVRRGFGGKGFGHRDVLSRVAVDRWADFKTCTVPSSPSTLMMSPVRNTVVPVLVFITHGMPSSRAT